MALRSQQAFPVGLYGLVVAALCWLAVPALSEKPERWLLGAVGLSVLAHAELLGVASAAAPPSDAEAVERLCADLRSRLRQGAVTGARALLPGASAPLLCGVTSVGRNGGGGQPSELRLDCTFRELEGCLPWITRGESLVGVLCAPGLGPAEHDGPEDPARVLLLNHPEAPRLPAAMAEDGGDRALRFLVEPAASLDPAPLRTTLWDDPYQASALSRSGQEVRTLDTGRDAGVPAGLLLGRAKVWGYERDGETLPIGVFVEPLADYRALSHVVLWQRGEAGTPEPEPPRLVPARIWPMPGSAEARFQLRAQGPVPEGAAVVRDGMFLGTVRGYPFGQGFGTSFAGSRGLWSLLLLPDDPARPPQELLAEVLDGAGGECWLRCVAGAAASPGFLFTGSNGVHCPPGLLIGRVEPQAEPGLLRALVARPASSPLAAVVVRGS